MRGEGVIRLEVRGGERPFFLPEETRGLDAILLLRRTGTVLGAWARESVNLDVISVMSATLLGSVESIVQAIGSASPKSVLVESERCRMAATQLSSQAVLFLMAPAATGAAAVRQSSRAIAARLEEEEAEAQRVPIEPRALPALVSEPIASFAHRRSTRRVKERTS